MGQKKSERRGGGTKKYMYLTTCTSSFMSCVAIFIVYNSMRVRARIAYWDCELSASYIHDFR